MSQWQERFAAQYKRYVQSLLRPGPGGLSPLDAEFKELQDQDWEAQDRGDCFVVGSQPVNRSKNRIETVLPNEATRISLHSAGGNDNTYINANFIDGQTLFGLPFSYIATQAPLDETVRDFWRLVAQTGVNYIVMLTDQHSATYWPQHQQQVLSQPPCTVQLLRATRTNDVITRELLLTTNTRMQRKVLHFQFLAWPEEGVPKNTLGLMDIILTLGARNDSVDSPILVHCGAGVGRTGVFIAMHVCLALFSQEKEFTVKHVVRNLKFQRTGMVQTRLQYQYLVCALNREFQRMVRKHQDQYRRQMVSGRVSPTLESLPGTVAPLKAVPSHMIGGDGKLIDAQVPLPTYTEAGSRPASPTISVLGVNPKRSEEVYPITQVINAALPINAGPPVAAAVGRVSPPPQLPPPEAPPPPAVYPTYPKELPKAPPMMTAGTGQDPTDIPYVAVGVAAGGPRNPPPAPSNTFAQRIHEAVYGGPAPGPSYVNVTVGTASNSPPPASLSSGPSIASYNPPPPPQQQHQQPQLPQHLPVAGTGTMQKSQHESVVSILQKLTEHNGRHRSAPAEQPRPNPMTQADGTLRSLSISPPRQGRPAAPVSGSNTYGLGGRVRPGVGGGTGDLQHPPSSTYLSQPQTQQPEFQPHVPTMQPQEGVNKYANEFEKSLFSS